MKASSQAITLQCGQRLAHYVQPGMRMVIVAGSVRIEGPLAALGEHVLQPVIRLREGDMHPISDTGWIYLSAISSAEGMCVADGVDPKPLWQSLLALFGLLRQRAASRYGI